MKILVVFLLVSSLAHWLAARWWLSTLPSPASRTQRRTVLGMTLGLSLVLVGARALVVFLDTPWTRLLVAIAMTELGVVLLALVPLGLLALSFRGVAGLAGLAAAAGRSSVKADRQDAKGSTPAAAAGEAAISRRQAVERSLGISLFGASSMALGWGNVRGRHAFQIEEVEVRIEGWPRVLDGYTIAQVSDIHVGTFVGDRELAEGFELVTKVRPDLLVATGDLVDFNASAAALLARHLARAHARDGVHAIVGNHDHYAGAATVVRHLRDAGINVLCNQSTLLRRHDGGGFALVGVDDLQGRARGMPGFRGPDLTTALREISPYVPRILLAHQPSYIREAAGRVALQLSGHTHGGQINPGFRPADLFLEYVAGQYERGGTKLYVNRGFGVAGPPARVGAPPEVTKIVLVSA